MPHIQPVPPPFQSTPTNPLQAAPPASAQSPATALSFPIKTPVQAQGIFDQVSVAAQGSASTSLSLESSPPEFALHTVKRGDSLTSIAKEHLGDPRQFMQIYEANKDIIGDNMNIIVPGQVLRIPALPEELK